MLLIVAPGQGAQTAGFLTDWLDLPTFADTLARVSEVAELDLAELGSTADNDTIRQTQIAQPLLVGAAMAAATALNNNYVGAANVYAGHSVGELASAALCGALSVDQAARLVARRGQAMAAAAGLADTSMVAILGGDATEVRAAVAQAGATAANDNGPGQVVAAGTRAQLADLLANPPAKARLIELSVAGAFHTEHMAPAVSELAALADTVTPAEPTVAMVSNKDGTLVTDGSEILNRIVGQVANPVRWDLCMQQFQALGVTGMLELPPAGTLTGIARRAMPGVELFALKTPAQLTEAREFCTRHLTKEN